VTPTENALVAYAILEQVDADREGGVAPEFLALDIARAQVYATLSTVKAPPTQEAIQEAISAVLEAGEYGYSIDVPVAAAEAVGRLL
jgi:hypothetical protein